MPKPPTPPDLKHCPTCGKVLGDHKGWFGPQCMCHFAGMQTSPGHTAGQMRQGRRVGGDPVDEADHFMTCPDCGQAFDMRRLGDVFHHNTPGHDPLPTN